MGRKAVQVSARVPSVSQKEWTLFLFLTYLFLSPLLLEAQEGMCFALENTRTMAVSSSHLTITFTFLGIPLGPLQTGQQLSSNPLLLRIPDFQEDVSPGWYFPSFPLPPSFSLLPPPCQPPPLSFLCGFLSCLTLQRDSVYQWTAAKPHVGQNPGSPL